MSKLQDRVIQRVNRARTLWAFAFILGAIPALYFMPLVAFILLYPIIGAATYMLTLIYVCVSISADITPEEVKEADEEERLEKEEEKRKQLVAKVVGKTPEEIKQIMKDADITAHSLVEETGPVIGHYRDVPIYMWVLMKAPGSELLEKFTYFGPARVVDGMPEIPVEEGKTFANIQGVLYAKEA